MTLERRRISRLVGLSTENTPTSLRRSEAPRIQNLDVDRGAMCLTRDGYRRLSPESLKDSSFRLISGGGVAANAPYNHALIIPRLGTRYDSADSKFYIAMRLQFAPNRLGTALGNMMILNISDGTDNRLRVRCDFPVSPAGTAATWHCTVTDTTPAAHTFTGFTDATLLNDSAIDVERFIEIGDLDDSGEVSMRVVDPIGDAQIGIESTSGWANGWQPNFNWLIGGWPDTTTGNLPDISVVFATGTFGAFRCNELRFESGFATTPTIGWAAGNGIANRELKSSEYAPATVKGYWRLNDGDYTQVRDFADASFNLNYSKDGGLLEPNHGIVTQVPPQWIGSNNQIPYVDNAGNPAQGLKTLHDYGLLFNGVEGVIASKTADVTASVAGQAVNPQTDPLAQIYLTNDWSCQVLFTVLMHEGETVFPDCVIYQSTYSNFGATTGVFPIKIDVVSNQFRVQFDDNTAIRTSTLTTHNVSAYRGRCVTLTVTRSAANAMVFECWGEGNTLQQSVAVTVATQWAPIFDSVNGPFVFLMREVDDTQRSLNANNRDHSPAAYGGPSAHGVFHEFRLWNRALNAVTVRKNSNVALGPGDRAGLVVYLTSGAGAGRSLLSLGQSASVSINTVAGPATVNLESAFHSRIHPSIDTAPILDYGLVDTEMPVKVTGAEQFRRSVGSDVTAEIGFVAGTSFYTADIDATTNDLTNATSTITRRFSGLRKTDELYSMVVFNNKLYMANGDRPRVWDGTHLRNAGILPPNLRCVIGGGNPAGINGIPEGIYFITYRYVNAIDGVVSNFAPLALIDSAADIGAGNWDLRTITDWEAPTDPQVTDIEFFITRTAGGGVLYRLEPPNVADSGIISAQTDPSAGITFTTFITDLLAETDDNNSFSINTDPAQGIVNQFWRHGAPPRTKAMAVIGARILYADATETGRIWFSRIDGGVQPEHIDMTPGIGAALDIKTDRGDDVVAMIGGDDSVTVYLRDARAEITFSGLDPAATGGVEIPFEIEIRENDIGTVSPRSVVQVGDVHGFLAETDIFVRSPREIRNLSSVSEDITNPARPKIGRTVRTLDGDFLKRAVALHRQAKQQIWFAVTRHENINMTACNDIILIYSYRDRKWMYYTISCDMMIEAEVVGDRRYPIGFVHGHLCALDDAGATIDSQESAFNAGITDTISAIGASPDFRKFDVTTGGLTAGTLRFRPAWTGSGGKFVRQLILDNGTDYVLLDHTDGVAPAVGDTIYVGSIMPRVDLMMQPSDNTVPKQYRYLNIAMDPGGGIQNVEFNVWVDDYAYDPDEAVAQVKGRTITATPANQFYSTDLHALGRVLRMQLLAPQPGAKLDINEISFEYKTLHRMRVDV